MKQAWLVGALLLNLAVVVTAALIVVQQTRQVDTKAATIPPAVPATLVVSGTITGNLRNIESHVTGQVSELAVQVGQAIEPSTVLVVLDDPELSANLLKARAQSDAVSSSLTGADDLLSSLREEVPQQIWTAQQKVADAETEVAERQENYDKVSRASWRLEKKARENLAASQVAEPAKLREIIEKTAETDMLSAQLQAARYQAALSEAQVRLAQAELDLAHAQVNSQKIETLAANVKLQHAQAGQARENLAILEAQLADLSIRSEKPGMVVSVNVIAGETVQPGTSLLTLASLDELYFEASIPASEVSLVNLGEQAEVRVDDWPDKRFPAQVIEVIRRSGQPQGDEVASADTAINRMRMRILSNTNGLLQPGTKAHVVLKASPGGVKQLN